MKPQSPVAALLAGAGLLMATLGLLGILELTLALLVAHPPGPTWTAAARQYYYWWERRIVQFLPECARYDSALTYTLRPGTCRFENREFSVELSVNRQGFRGSEGDLRTPEIVVAGDSYAMGWGVAQDSIFTAILSRVTGKTVLNTGVSSYGTARELLALRNVDLSQTRYVVIQYSSNDLTENEEYLRAGGRLKVRTSAAYDSLVREHRLTTRYVPGKYTLRYLPVLRDAWLRDSAIVTRAPREFAHEASVFLDVLRLAPVALDSVTIVVFELEPLGSPPSRFAAELETAVRARGGVGRQLLAVDLVPHLRESDYFVLDDHLRASGHAKVAAVVGEAVAKADGMLVAKAPQW